MYGWCRKFPGTHNAMYRRIEVWEVQVLRNQDHRLWLNLLYSCTVEMFFSLWTPVRHFAVASAQDLLGKGTTWNYLHKHICKMWCQQYAGISSGLGNTRRFYCNSNSRWSELQGIGQILSPIKFLWKELIKLSGSKKKLKNQEKTTIAIKEKFFLQNHSYSA